MKYSNFFFIFFFIVGPLNEDVSARNNTIPATANSTRNKQDNEESIANQGNLGQQGEQRNQTHVGTDHNKHANQKPNWQRRVCHRRIGQDVQNQHENREYQRDRDQHRQHKQGDKYEQGYLRYHRRGDGGSKTNYQRQGSQADLTQHNQDWASREGRYDQGRGDLSWRNSQVQRHYQTERDQRWQSRQGNFGNRDHRDQDWHSNQKEQNQYGNRYYQRQGDQDCKGRGGHDNQGSFDYRQQENQNWQDHQEGSRHYGRQSGESRPNNHNRHVQGGYFSQGQNYGNRKNAEQARQSNYTQEHSNSKGQNV